MRRWKGMEVQTYQVLGELVYGWFMIDDAGHGWLRKSE
jgi:hypothetical protein